MSSLAPARPSLAKDLRTGRREMGESLSKVGAITMFIEDTQRSKAFYERVFGVQAAYEDENAVAFDYENMIVNLLRVPAAHDLIAPAPVGGADAARRFQVTICVEDTDAACDRLRARRGGCADG